MIELSGSYIIPASLEEVWSHLNNPQSLQSCLPGCEALEAVSETEMEAALQLKIGPMKVKFKGSVTISDITPLQSYKITGEGKGGAAGFAKGHAFIELVRVEDTQTSLNYQSEAKVGGKLAQVGSRLVSSSAQKIIDEFCVNFVRLVSQEGEALSQEGENIEGEKRLS